MISDLTSGDIPTTGEVIGGLTRPSTFLAEAQFRYNTSSIED